MVGSSIIRDLDERLYSNTQVDAVSGATAETVTKLLQNRKENGEKFLPVIILAASNQLNFDGPHTEKSIDETVRDKKAAVAAAQELNSKVTVCELPPCTHKDSVAELGYHGTPTCHKKDATNISDNVIVNDGMIHTCMICVSKCLILVCLMSTVLSHM